MIRPVFSISQVARRMGISTRTIRVYEEEGFIIIRRVQGRCLIAPEDVERITMIERLKADLGLNIAGIGVILEMRQKIMALQERLEELERGLDR